MRTLMMAILVLLGTVLTGLAGENDQKDWPEVLKIDDFEAGIERWENEDTGSWRRSTTRRRAKRHSGGLPLMTGSATSFTII